MEENKNDSIRPEIRMQEDELINRVADVIFPNVKLYVESALQKFDSLFTELHDLKLNIATISSIVHSKEVFTEDEYRRFFSQIKESFENVDSEGNMRGEISFMKYGF